MVLSVSFVENQQIILQIQYLKKHLKLLDLQNQLSYVQKLFSDIQKQLFYVQKLKSYHQIRFFYVQKQLFYIQK